MYTLPCGVTYLTVFSFVLIGLLSLFHFEKGTVICIACAMANLSFLSYFFSALLDVFLY